MTDDVKICKRIMQTWKGPIETLPEAWKTSPESIKLLMPDYEHVFMTDKDNDEFIAKHFPQYLEAFRGFKYGIQRADFVRYAWLATGESGIYLDCDYELARDLSELFLVDREFYVCPSGNFANYYTNAVMASQPGAKIWLEAMEEAVKPPKWYWLGKHLYVMNTTGPMMLSRVIARQDPSSYHILNSKLLTPCSVCDEKPCYKEGAYMKTLPGSSWIATDTRIFIYWKCQWRGVLILITIFLIVYLVLLSLRAFRKHK